MQDALTIYFNGEKNGGLLLTGIGVVGLAAAAPTPSALVPKRPRA